MIKIEIPQRQSNIIYGSDDGKRYYLAVCTDGIKEERHKREWGKKTPAYMFDGNHFTLDQFPPAIFRLREYIKLNHTFTIGGGGRPLSKRKDSGKDIPLANVLYGFYNGVDIEGTDSINVRCINSNAVVLSKLTDPEEVEFFRTHYVYDFRMGNVVSDIGGGVVHSNGHIVVDYPAMSVKCDGRSFCTSYDQGLCNLLTAVPNWNLVRGALKANVGTGESGKSIFVPYASIVVAYHRGLVPTDTDNIREKLKVIDQKINRKQLLVDHLTERMENNYPFLLALTNRKVNDTARNFRTRIKKPFFFYSVVDHARKICLVWLGIEGTGWERHIVFGDLTDERECELWDEKIQELTADIAENNRKIEENQAKLALYGSIYGDITGDMDAYRSALANFSNVASTIDTISGSFQTLANLQAEVANGFTMSLDKALEFAKVYPEILNSAQATADGQILLNKDVVNSFIEGKKAELDVQIDAEVAKLEADKEVLQAKMEAAQAQLDLAKAVAEGEGDISKELAEYRINAGNAVAQALIDAGIDEATAFKLAAAAMAQNAEEFDRVAMEVCTDVNGNFNQAAYDLAQTMYNNLTNVKTDLASVATQAHETAKAIAGVANGSVAGSSAVQGGSGGGTGSSGIKLNLTSGSFEGTEYTYTAKESGLEDFISQIELDISNYQDAISQIDGQIAALQALKNTPLKSFKGSGTGSSGSSSSSTKEVEEYIASIDEYRDAVERLRKAQEEADKLETEIDNAGSFEKKIELQEKLIAAYREEQAALHNLNNMRDSTITQGVETLRELGFAVQYNADTNELWIENLEHLNELTADSAGEYGSLQEATNALREGTEDLIGTITDLNDANREGSESWWELNRSIIETTISMYENMMQARKNAAMLAENGMDNAIDTKNLADVKKFSAAMIAEYQDMQRILHEETEYYRSLGYSDTSDEVSKLSDLWWDYADNIKSVKEQVVDYLIDIVDAASDSLDEIRNVSDVLHDAADEFAANDGFITIDTWNALRKVGTQYMQMLVDENGVYQINEERINAVIAARTRQLAVENAMSYVERLKLAAQEGSIEDLNNLIFATTDATNSTWGLVYAELELMHTMGDLNDSQYQAALHNIQVMQDLAENAIQNIGKATDSVAKNLEETRKQLEATKKGLQDTLDELEDMQDGAGDLVDYVMDMLKHRIQQQINLLGEMKDKYSEIIDLKKKSLDATKDEQDYQKTIAKKLKEMAKLQDRINALSLDDSRSAQAERAKLLEQMAELQENLADTQADKSIEAQKEALDKMEEDYHAEKDEEIKILENSISSTQKLYDMAIEYIRNNWDTLYSELIAWNTEYGTSLNSEITEAWEAAQAAVQRYGDFVSAIMGGISAEIDSITRQIEALDEQMSNLSTSSGSSGTGGTGTDNRNTTVGNKVTHTSPTSEDMVRTIVGRMKEYGAAWNRNNDKATNDALHQKAADLAKQLDQYGVHAEFRDSDGTWWITQDKLNPSNIGKLLHSCYHTGGFVGDEPLKPNERYIKAENGELILTSDQQDSFAAQIDRIGAMTEKFMGTQMSMAQPILPDFSHLGGGTINNVTNSSSQPVTINQGDVIIQGAVMSPKQLAKNINPYIDVTRDMANQLARMMRSGRLFSNRGGLDNSMWK